MPLRSLTLGPIVAAVLLAPLSVARAADLDENYGYADAPQEVPVAQSKVEFGTGWYVRGDLGVTRLPRLSETTGTYVPALQVSTGADVGYSASLGAGYSFTKYFRSDIIADFNKPVKSSSYIDSTCAAGFAPKVTGVDPITGAFIYQSPSPTFSEACSDRQGGSLRSYDVLVNGYVDIGTWYHVTPYIGVGVGLSFGYISASSNFTQTDGTSYNFYATDPSNGSSYHFYKDGATNQNYYNFAFALMAGFSVDVYDHTKLDIGYRYRNLGRVLGAQIDSQEVRAGLRYMIDN